MDWELRAARLAEVAERRFYGKYRGKVVDNEDPESLGRLKVTVPSVLGEEVVTGWAWPCVPYGGAANQGMLFIPGVDAKVWIEFEEGDLEFPIWVGTFWTRPGGNSELPRPNDEEGVEEGSVQSPPTRKIFKTLAGHTLQFEDDDQEVRVLVADGQNENRIVLGQSALKVVYKSNTITLSDDGIVIEDANGNTVTQDNSGMVIEDANGNKIVMGAAGIKVGSDSSGEPFVLGQQFKLQVQNFLIALSTHTHVGNLGAPTSPPMGPFSLDVPLSTKHKTE